MSILIKGMEMPQDKEICLRIDEKGEVYVCGSYPTELHRAVSIPPHGDLMDRDAFLAEQRRLYCEHCRKRLGMKNGKMQYIYDIGDAPCRACECGDVLDVLEDAPAIIEAEGEG